MFRIFSRVRVARSTLSTARVYLGQASLGTREICFLLENVVAPGACATPRVIATPYTPSSPSKRGFRHGFLILGRLQSGHRPPSLFANGVLRGFGICNPHWVTHSHYVEVASRETVLRESKIFIIAWSRWSTRRINWHFISKNGKIQYREKFDTLSKHITHDILGIGWKEKFVRGYHRWRSKYFVLFASYSTHHEGKTFSSNLIVFLQNVQKVS